MAKVKISEWSTTPSSNTDIDGINIAEGCAPSGINDAIRDLMAQVRSWQSGDSGDPFNGPMNGTIGSTTAYAGAFTTLSASSTVTLSGGTANGVAYLNGSKVLTSGSALTFDGSNMAVGGASISSYANYKTLAVGGGTSGGVLDFKDSGNVVRGELVGDSTGLNVSGQSGVVTFSAQSAGELMRLTSTGLGIKTSSVGLPLSIGASGTGFFGSGSVLNTYVNSNLGTTLDASGNLGIGTSSPSQKLTVAGNINLTPSDSRFLGGDATGRLIVSNSDTTTYLAMYGSSHATVPNSLALIAGSGSLTLTNSGNLGLGVTPSAGLATANYRLFEIGLDGGGSIYSGTNQTLIGTNIAWSGGTPNYKRTGSAPTLYNQQNGAHSWSTAGAGTAGNAITFSQVMTLDSSGNLLVGTTSSLSVASKVQVSSASSVAYFYTSSTGSDGCYVDIAGDNKFFEFRKAGVEKGNISFNGTLTVYNTTSDYRLKNVTGVVTGHGARIDALKPIDYQWKEDNSQARGFLAHEFQTVYPNSVTGEKDAVDANGNPKYQSMQASTPEVIADLVAEIQSLRKRLADAGI